MAEATYLRCGLPLLSRRQQDPRLLAYVTLRTLTRSHLVRKLRDTNGAVWGTNGAVFSSAVATAACVATLACVSSERTGVDFKFLGPRMQPWNP